MEFLRFGSSIPGSYWGCCAVDIIQNFNYDPDAKASIQLVDGDGGTPILGKDGKSLFAGPTYGDIFKQRIRIGTFSTTEMPNHTFLAVLTSSQVASSYGKKWLALMKAEGFEFIRTMDNSVYTGSKLLTEDSKISSHPNYLFGLFRNIGNGAIEDPYKAPTAWEELPCPYGGDMSPEALREAQTAIWEASSKPTFLTEEEVIAAGAPVTYAGKRSRYPQQDKYMREYSEKQDKNINQESKAAPWATKPTVAPTEAVKVESF